MSSIAGIYGETRGILGNIDTVHLMSKTMAHRGSGLHYNYSSSLMDFEINSLEQIKVNNSQVYDGEEYVIAIDGELNNKGELIHNSSDCELSDAFFIANLINSVGYDFVKQIDGQYCILVYEKKSGDLHLIRDRWAQKPIYYIKTSEYVAFSSEIKGFTVLPDWKAKLNMVTARDYLLWSGMRDASNQTLFDGVFQIEGGCSITVKKDLNCTYNRYYDPSKIKQGTDKEDAICRFREYFKESIKTCVTNNNIESVGTCLSGGIDSTTIASFIVDNYKENKINNKLKTFTAYFSAPEADEREYIDEAIDKLKLDSKKISPTFDTFIKDLDELLWIQDEPFSSSAIFAQNKVYKCASDNGIRYLCDGQAADEYLCGYRSHQIAYICDLIRKFKIVELKRTLKTIRAKYNEKIKMREIAKQLLFRPLPKFMIYKQAQNKNAEYGFRFLPLRDALIYENYRNVKMTLRDYSLMQMRVGWPKLYHHIDRNAMNYSIVNRAPFAQTKMVEFVIGLPGEVLMSEGITKYLLRSSARGFTPDKILDRYSKLGFKTPEALWFEDNKEWFNSEFEKALSRLESLFDKDKARETKDKDFIFRVICFSHWVDVFNVEI